MRETPSIVNRQRATLLAIISIGFITFGVLLTFVVGKRVPQHLQLAAGHEHNLFIESVVAGRRIDNTLYLCLRVRNSAYPSCPFHERELRNVGVALSRRQLEAARESGRNQYGAFDLKLDQSTAESECAVVGVPVQVESYSHGLFWTIEPREQALSDFDIVQATGSVLYVGVYLTQPDRGPFIAWVEFTPTETRHEVPWHEWLVAVLYDLVRLPVTIAGLLIFGPG